MASPVPADGAAKPYSLEDARQDLLDMADMNISQHRVTRYAAALAVVEAALAERSAWAEHGAWSAQAANASDRVAAALSVWEAGPKEDEHGR